MKERPILFSGPMVRAILKGKKNQTRRILKLDERVSYIEIDGKQVPKTIQKFVCGRSRAYITACEMRDGIGPWWHPHAGHLGEPLPADRIAAACPYGKPGDRLWVREAFAVGRASGFTYYRADGDGETINGNALKNFDDSWRPSIHMHRHRSRITLEVLEVSVEKLQDISEADAKAEGVQDLGGGYKNAFGCLWAEINGPDSLGKNPWVWVVKFKTIGSANGI